MACICDNQSIFYNQPLTFQSSSNTLELTFIASKLNITEDFMDLYFYASYEIVRVSDCKRRHKLTSTGGEESAYFNIKSSDSDCNSMAWLLEAKKLDHSLFLQTWGAFIPSNPTAEDMMKCQTKNRLIIYSGHTMGTIRIICPMHKSESKVTSTLNIFSEDWMNSFTMPTKWVTFWAFLSFFCLELNYLQINNFSRVKKPWHTWQFSNLPFKFFFLIFFHSSSMSWDHVLIKIIAKIINKFKGNIDCKVRDSEL